MKLELSRNKYHLHFSWNRTLGNEQASALFRASRHPVKINASKEKISLGFWSWLRRWFPSERSVFTQLCEHGTPLSFKHRFIVKMKAKSAKQVVADFPSHVHVAGRATQKSPPCVYRDIITIDEPIHGVGSEFSDIGSISLKRYELKR